MNGILTGQVLNARMQILRDISLEKLKSKLKQIYMRSKYRVQNDMLQKKGLPQLQLDDKINKRSSRGPAQMMTRGSISNASMVPPISIKKLSTRNSVLSNSKQSYGKGKLYSKQVGLGGGRYPGNVLGMRKGQLLPSVEMIEEEKWLNPRKGYNSNNYER